MRHSREGEGPDLCSTSKSRPHTVGGGGSPRPSRKPAAEEVSPSRPAPQGCQAESLKARVPALGPSTHLQAVKRRPVPLPVTWRRPSTR